MKTFKGPREAGPHGKTLEMIEFSSEHRTTWVRGRHEPRDRSLIGKARRKRRKELQRRPVENWS